MNTGMPPQWDENKRISNLKKHGVDFKDVAKVFNPGRYVLYEDIDDSIMKYGELRKKFIGEFNGRFYNGVMTFRNEDQRLISAPPASRRNIEIYLKNKDLIS